MKKITSLLLAVAIVTGVAAALARTSPRTDAQAAVQSAAEPTSPTAKEIRGASPYVELENEKPPKLIVDPPLPEGLAIGVVWIQWRVENVNVVPVFGKGSLHVSPRVGHLHIHVDDVGWWWADASNINTIDLAGMRPGPHKIRIELVNSNHEPFPGQSRTVSFTIPNRAASSRSTEGRE